MRTIFLTFTFLFTLSTTLAQIKNKSEKQSIEYLITSLFEGMRLGDSAMVSATLHDDILMQTIFVNKEEKTEIRTEKSAEGFLNAVGTPHEEIWDERIHQLNIQIDENMAHAWVPYHFYRGNTFSHCGVNSMQLVKTAAGWKIIYLIDTRRKENCL